MLHSGISKGTVDIFLIIEEDNVMVYFMPIVSSAAVRKLVKFFSAARVLNFIQKMSVYVDVCFAFRAALPLPLPLISLTKLRIIMFKRVWHRCHL